MTDESESSDAAESRKQVTEAQTRQIRKLVQDALMRGTTPSKWVLVEHPDMPGVLVPVDGNLFQLLLTNKL
jgi:hypothetical protein